MSTDGIAAVVIVVVSAVLAFLLTLPTCTEPVGRDDDDDNEL